MNRIDPELDLTVERVIRAPRATVWKAWTDPEKFARWWVPAPAICRVERLEVRPGGAMVTRMSEDGTRFVPHMDAVVLVADELERIVFSNAINSDWRPVTPDPIAMAAEITLADHADGTDYRIVVRHADPASRARHAELGFADGWGSVTKQLATVAEATSRDEARADGVPDARRCESGTGVACRGHECRVHPRRLVGAVHRPDVRTTDR